MVAGYAIGGGHVLHVCCDLSIAADNAVFGQTGPKVGSLRRRLRLLAAGRDRRPEAGPRDLVPLPPVRRADGPRLGAGQRGRAACAVLEEETVSWAREMLDKSPLAAAHAQGRAERGADGAAGMQQFAGTPTLLYYMSEEAQELAATRSRRSALATSAFPRRAVVAGCAGAPGRDVGVRHPEVRSFSICRTCRACHEAILRRWLRRMQGGVAVNPATALATVWSTSWCAAASPTWCSRPARARPRWRWRCTPIAGPAARARSTSGRPPSWRSGLARRAERPVALICTSGTAAANFHPAVIEAHESGVPLLVLTADRPARAARHRRQPDDRPDQAVRHGASAGSAEVGVPEDRPGPGGLLALPGLPRLPARRWARTTRGRST